MASPPDVLRWLCPAGALPLLSGCTLVGAWPLCASRGRVCKSQAPADHFTSSWSEENHGTRYPKTAGHRHRLTSGGEAVFGVELSLTSLIEPLNSPLLLRLLISRANPQSLR